MICSAPLRKRLATGNCTARQPGPSLKQASQKVAGEHPSYEFCVVVGVIYCCSHFEIQVNAHGISDNHPSFSQSSPYVPIKMAAQQSVSLTTPSGSRQLISLSRSPSSTGRASSNNGLSTRSAPNMSPFKRSCNTV